MSERKQHIDTKLIHAGEPIPRIEGAVMMPIFQSSTFESPGGDSYDTMKYIRLNNTPNHQALHDKLSALENAESALVTASGMAAISTALFTLLKPGGHLLAQDVLYGGTLGLLDTQFEALGLSYDFIDGRDPSSWESKLKPDTKAIYVETISNPLMGVPELSEVVDFARSHELISMVDNTFASPVNFRPAEWGFDLSFHSGTKYLGGHSDIVAGAVIGRKDLVRDVFVNLKYYGGSLDPHACFLLHRGLKTLGVRVRQQNQNALAVAQFLEKHAAIADVKYPGLPSSPDHERATRFLDAEAARRIMDRVEIPIVAPSLGGVESLFSMPATTSHLAVPPDERAAMGIGDGMIRMSVGIESADDLIEDLRQAIG
jgi:cystathionine beta-lyase/cystathionine gamma-synthase